MKRVKTTLIVSGMFAFSLALQAQVGVNNTSPKSSLHVTPAKTDGSTAEGIIAPNLTRAQLISKDAKYGSDQKGAMVYVTTIDGTVTTKTGNILKVGYYYFDGSVWQTFTSGAANIPTEPWQVQGGTTQATSNAENIYQTGSVGIGASTAVPAAYKFQVTGASNVTGNSQVASSTVTGNETVGGALTVAGTTTLNGATNAKATTITGQLRYTPGTPAANKVLISSDANGNVTWGTAQNLITIPTEPWMVQGGTTQATSNAEDIYQTGSVGIGANTSVADGYKFQVTGASYVTGNSRVGGGSTILGNETVAGTLAVTGNSTLISNVGIGAAPVAAYKLQVTGASNVTGNSQVASSTVVGNETVGGTLGVTGAATLSNALTVAGTTTLNGSTNAKATTITGQLRYTQGAPAANKVLISSDANGNATWGTAQNLITIPTEPWMVQGGTTQATGNTQNIYQMGSVGIGANTSVADGYKFQVTGASYVTGNSRVGGGSTILGNETVAGTLAVTGNSTLISNVGIGAAPVAAYKLQVTGASNITGNSRVGSSTVVGNEQVSGNLGVTGTSTLTGNVGIGSAPNSTYKLLVTGSANVTANTLIGGSGYVTGSVGIGTTTLSQKLNVAGNAYVTGSLGLGIASPAQKLHVVGNEFVSGITKIGGPVTTAGAPTLNASAQLELGDTNKGFLPNRVALTAAAVKTPVTNAVDGMVVYNTATVTSQGLTPGLYYWRNNSWQRLVDQIPTVHVNMYYQTASVKGGTASGYDQSKMVSIPFSTSRATNAPTTIKLPEVGSYAFNVKLYSSVGSTGPSVGVSGSGKVVAYVGIWINGQLQDVSEVFFMISPLGGTGGANGNYVTNVVLGCSGNAGDTVDIRLGYYSPSVPSGNAVWSQGSTSATPISAATSMIYWKL